MNRLDWEPEHGCPACGRSPDYSRWTAYFFPNETVAVFNEEGKQVPQLQGRRHEVEEKILELRIKTVE